ncbi:MULTISPECIES: hypothetical protein [Pseudomonas]|uniref:hypothetical protein n=1 Tax=Pseudomonas TaxID=286 RepID=UPI001F2C9CF9|nr:MULTISPECIES: hypothetical protein [Pseudomonas]
MSCEYKKPAGPVWSAGFLLPARANRRQASSHNWRVVCIDIAISKLGRATDQDVSDIMALLRAGFILATEFRRLALQAIDMYVGNKESPVSILTNILHDYLETEVDEAF